MEEKSMMQQFVDCLRNEPNHAYDFIANNYHLFSKSELADIVKELLYGIYYEAEYGLITNSDHNKILENTADQIEESMEE